MGVTFRFRCAVHQMYLRGVLALKPVEAGWKFDLDGMDCPHGALLCKGSWEVVERHTAEVPERHLVVADEVRIFCPEYVTGALIEWLAGKRLKTPYTPHDDPDVEQVRHWVFGDSTD